MKRLYYLTLLLTLPLLGIAQTDMAKMALQPDRGPIIDNISANVGTTVPKTNEAVNQTIQSHDSEGNEAGSHTGGAQVGEQDGQVVVDERSTRVIEDDLESTLDYIKNQLRFFPNPTVNQLNVDLGDEYEVTISLMNVLGQEVYSTEGLQESITIPVSDLPRGTYFLTVQYQGEVIVKRIELTN